MPTGAARADGTEAMPNVLIIITDQQRADHSGFMGNPVVRTPSLDALAARSRVFDNAWVSNPVCMPNRSTLMTGRMPSAHGVIFNDRSLDWGSHTFVRQFRAAGYRTGLIGKSHLQHGMSRNSVLPFRGQPVACNAWPPGWDTIENEERFAAGESPSPHDFYGFDHIELSIDHGARVAGHHLHWALQRGGTRAMLCAEYGPDAPGSDRSRHWWQVYRAPYPEELHSTTFVTERSMAFIETAAGQGKPWLAWCSYPDPHHPMSPPGRWFDRHRAADMPLPGSFDDPLVDAPAHLRQFQRLHPRDQRNWVAPCGAGSAELVREAQAATFGMIEMIDDGIGRLLACVERLGQSNDTIVVFTSDHGDMMGDHGLLLKGFMHYRGTLQVPLVVHVPKGTPGRSHALASSIDVAPTLLALAGLPAYDGIQGQSLEPVLEQADASVRDHVLIEDDIAPVTASLTPIPGKTRTLITPTHRYTRNSKGEEQLFCLREDPDEMHDLKRTDAAARTACVEQLMDALIRADDAARGAPSTQPLAVDPPSA